jgi:hypothetical protein
MIHVGIVETCEELASYPATVEGYCNAVFLIDHLIGHEDGRYYLDVPEDFERP